VDGQQVTDDWLDERVDPRGADFDDLFYGHAARVTRLAALLGAEDPEDVAAEAFCRLYAARGRIHGNPNEVVAYLNRIVVNEVRDRFRRRSHAASRAHLVRVAATTPGADGLGVAVRDALAGLPPRQREAIVLRYWLDLPVAGIADAMGVRPGTAKSLVSRGLDALEAVLTDPEEGR
jgi:DNA-directed RNA polymerase specialized sigma24 family protein